MAFAQEATPPSSNSGGQTSGSALPASSATVPPSAYGTESTPEQPAEKKPAAAATEEGFSLPGGFGYAPLNFTPGQGKFEKEPLSFSTTLQQGYDDNIYSSSGKAGSVAKKGSMVTNLSEGVEILLAQSRLGLSLDAGVGGIYYWDRTGDQLTPNANLNLLFAYKLTPRAQFSAVVTGVYTSQSSQSPVYGVTQSTSGKSYFTTNSKFDFLYKWTPRFSTDTTYANNSIYYPSTTQSTSNYVEQTLGQSLRYGLTEQVTGVLEGRVSDTTYKLSTYDTTTYYFLVGADVTFSRRFSGTFRIGDTTRNYQNGGGSSASSPYFEATTDYSLTKYSKLGCNLRYGFEPSTYGGGNKAARAGVSFSQVFTPKLRGAVSVNFGNLDYAQNGATSATTLNRNELTTTLGVQYALTQRTSVFSNISRIQVFSSNENAAYNRDMIYLGATFQY